MEKNNKTNKSETKNIHSSFLHDFDKVELFSSKLDDYRENAYLTVGFLVLYFIGVWVDIFEMKIPLLYSILLAAFYLLVNLTVWLLLKKFGKINLLIHYCTLLLDIIILWLVLYITGGLESPFFIFIFIFVFAVMLRYPLRDGLLFSSLSILLLISFILIDQLSGKFTPLLLYNGIVHLISIVVISIISFFLSFTYKKILHRIQLKDHQLEDILNEMRYQQKEIEETNINMNKIIQKQKVTQRDLNKRIQELSLILEITHQLHSILDIEELINLFIDKIKNFLTYDDIEIYILNDDNITYRCVKEFGTLKVDFYSKDNIIISNGYIKDIINSKDVIYSPKIDKKRIGSEKMIKGVPVTSMIYAPLYVTEKLIGFIKIAFFNVPQNIETLIPALNILTNIFAQSIENNLLFENQKMLNLKFQTDMRLAHDIQLKIIPDKYPKHLEFEFGAQYIPSEHIGGDYYDFIDLGNDKIGCIISDISGHGVGAAMVMSMVKSFVHNYFIKIDSPKKALELINQEIKKYILEEDYLTILYGILDLNTGEFIYSNGGHTQPYYYNFIKDEITPLAATGSLIGIFDNISIDQQAIILNKGDFILMYTDGIIDNRNRYDENFNKNRMMDIINTHKFFSADELCANVIDNHLAFVGDMKLKDDISLLVLKRLPEILFERSWDIQSDLKNIKTLLVEFEEIFISEKILEKDIYNLKLILTEAIINAIIHGNKNKAERLVNIEIRITTGSFTAQITDEGEGFYYQEFTNKEISPENIHKESGRGLFLIMSIADNVRFNESGNSIIITKKITRKI
ncbi:MAG: SpoIIE family protein phosphatase [bacterium]|nr:SpoIIE family protein phosphatase [bacterium]